MSVTVLNTTASLSGKTLLKAEDTQTITGAKTFDLGTSAPFVVVVGAAKVANLDADLLDGESAASFHDASQLTGTLPAISGVNLTNLNATNLASGTVPDARFPATLPAASGINLTALNATNLASGTAGTARLGSGSASASTFLRGDSTWATPTGLSRGFSAGGTGVQAQNTTNYYNEAFRDATEAAVEYLVGADVTFTKLYIRLAAALGGAAQTATFTLRKNGAATAITCQIASGVQTANDTIHSVSFTAGDRICLECVLSATTGNTQVQGGLS